MSFYSDMTAALLTDAETALSLDAGDAYAGREPQRVDLDVEVWLEPGPADRGGSGAHRLKAHGWRVHVRVLAVREADQTGASQVSTVKGHLETLVDRWNGSRALVGTVSSLAVMTAREDTIDESPDQHGKIDGVVALTAWEL